MLLHGDHPLCEIPSLKTFHRLVVEFVVHNFDISAGDDSFVFRRIALFTPVLIVVGVIHVRPKRCHLITQELLLQALRVQKFVLVCRCSS